MHSGGIPLCFPQFGPPGKVPQQHGFARNLDWEVCSSSADVNPDYPEPSVLLKLSASEYTRKLYPYEFEATLEVTLRRDRLKLELSVINRDNQPIDFTAALHTYIEVLFKFLPSMERTKITLNSYAKTAGDRRLRH